MTQEEFEAEAARIKFEAAIEKFRSEAAEEEPIEAPAAPPQEPYRGSILPVTVDENGPRFDINSGITGAIKDAVMFPGRVMDGEVDNLYSDESIGNILNMAGMGSINPAVRAGAAPNTRLMQRPSQVGKMNRLKVKNDQLPTRQAIRAEGNRQYDDFRRLGPDYEGLAVDEAVRVGMNKAQHVRGEHPIQAKGVTKKLKDYGLPIRDPDTVTDASITANDILNLRQGLGSHRSQKIQPGASNAKHARSEQIFAGEIIDELDDLITTGGAQASRSNRPGVAEQASRNYAGGNQNWAAQAKAKKVEQLWPEEKYHGPTVRKKAARLKEQEFGWSPKQRKMLDNLSHGGGGVKGAAVRGLDTAGRFLGPNLGGVMRAAVLGAAGGPVGQGAAIAALAGGKLASTLSKGSMKKQHAKLLADVLRNSNLAQRMRANAPLASSVPATQEALLKALVQQKQQLTAPQEIAPGKVVY